MPRLFALLAVWTGPGCGRDTLTTGVSATTPAMTPANGGSAGASGVGGAAGGVSLGLPEVAITDDPGAAQLLNEPIASVVGDWNRDGIPDLAVTIKGQARVSVVLGGGNGALLPRKEFSTGARPVAVATADWNRDGNPDLVTVNEASSNATILFGKGDGTFGGRVDLAVGEFPRALAVGDWTGDGAVDLIAGDTLFAGGGDGTFARGRGYGLSPALLATADLDRDGYLDLVASPDKTDIVTLLGRGDGTFARKSGFKRDGWLWVMTLADLNGDGKPELALLDSCVGRGHDDKFSLFFGTGDGWFGDVNRYVACGDNFGIGDVNGDGNVDTMVGAEHVLLGQADGRFLPSLFVASPAVRSDQLVGLADWTGDGRLDLAVVSTDAILKVLPGTGRGTFEVLSTFGARVDPLALP